MVFLSREINFHVMMLLTSVSEKQRTNIYIDHSGMALK